MSHIHNVRINSIHLPTKSARLLVDTFGNFKYLHQKKLSGFYTGWLLPAAMVGLGVFLYGLFTLDHNVSAREVCSDQARK